MKLDIWLTRAGITRLAFAKSLGVSPGTITALCNGEAPWMSRDTAERIAGLTGGAVTPNDFIGLKGPRDEERAMLEATERVKAALDAFAKGQIVVVTDDDDRENEGDLIVAASLCTPEQMAFIVRHTSGIVCTPLSVEEARRLRLDPMVSSNDSPHGTAFTVSVDYRHGTTTGISADDRTATVRGLANPNAGAVDFVRPGHIFPLIAKDGGVLMRSGHTEAAVDLCKLAGLPPVGVICELVNDDGTVTRGPQVAAFAEKHGLVTVSVADLIKYRQARDRLVERAGEFPIETPYGPARGIAYRTPYDKVEHLAIVFGEVEDNGPTLVRLHRETVLRDVFGKNPVIDCAVKRLAEKGGVLIYLRDGTAGVPSQSLAASAPQPDVHESHGSAKMRDEQWREIGLGAQILRDLGVHTISLLAFRNRHYVGLGGFGIEIKSTEMLDA
ncbi:3,4-dihydroxy-2-butanone-4-phosphate synthase [Phreatobacter stygius]|uniref:3,4-dihydroxy-2-butanone 4-phosphate synthase n=4 Tax=Pseudomonadota TaxID=1224 RepID=A0A4D7BDZ0_9HYPH|nr:3,4-dihydroxy-2-butanone-4-phosphate synthase [Phreatobacter stygius]QCI66157.1 3,4-dihydroxy-2-butanone-4-phosphate synthase [Phreatobacter stygius]